MLPHAAAHRPGVATPWVRGGCWTEVSYPPEGASACRRGPFNLPGGHRDQIPCCRPRDRDKPRALRSAPRNPAKDPGAEFILLVPATPVRHLLFLHGNEQDAAAVANKLAKKAQEDVDAQPHQSGRRHVGSESPIDAIDHEIAANPGYAGFVISTLPQETSRWLRMGLPTVVAKKYGLPVHHVQAAPDWTANSIPETALSIAGGN